MRLATIAALVGSTALIATPAAAQTEQQMSGGDCKQLVSYLQQDRDGKDRRGGSSAQRRDQDSMPVTLQEARKYQRTNDQQACREAIQQLARQGHDVRRADRQEQRSTRRGTRVQVQQQAPEVSVTQPMPEIIVRQAPPTITIDQPQPEIIVRMPRPDVDVATAPPEVEVHQPKPRVNVSGPQEQRAAQVQQEGQPRVRYERTGEPRVEYRRAEGQPRVRYEQQRSAQADDRGERTTQRSASRDEQERQAQTRRSSRQMRDAERRDTADRQDTDMRDDPQQTTLITAQRLQGMEVENARGDNLGTVDQVVIDGDRDIHLVVAYGGFLGIGERSVAIPLDRFELYNDTLIIFGMTDDELRQLAQYDEEESGMRDAAPNQRARLPVRFDSGMTGQQ